MMKRGLVFIMSFVFCLSGILASADLAFKAGLNQSKLMSGPKRHWATGFSLGIAVSFKQSGNFYIQPECFFVRKGDGIGFPEVIPGMKSKIVLDYLETSLLFKRYFLNKGKIRMAGLGGGYVAFNIQAKCQSEYLGQVFTESLKDDVKKKDYGLVLGVNLEASIGRKKLILDIRYNLGISKINSFISYDNWKNRCLSMMLGIGL
ncbi:MAG: porin family protein [Candidatus Aminicenantales bacterium]